MKILIIEDDKQLSDFLRRGLIAEGYNVENISRADEAMAFLRAVPVDIIILDRLLEDGDGLKICREVRQLNINCKIIMLSALSEVEDKILGLRTGADDYLGKPFHFEELLARLEALALRNNEPLLEHSLCYADLSLNLARLEAKRGDKEIEMTAKELRILEMLLRNPERILTRERILNHVWGLLEDPMTNIVDVYMARLRRKIDDGYDTKLIKTRRGLGYVLSQ